MDVSWIKIRSWHVIRTWTRVPGRAITLCGRTASGPESETLPSLQKSCENCARILIRREDAA